MDGNKSSETVSTVGNAWIICRSKSHPGHIYYFNTLTGETAWNLSEVEVEKAKKRTKMLETQSGSKLDRCPEPNEPPLNASQSVFKNTIRPPFQARSFDKQLVTSLTQQTHMFPQTDQYSLPSSSAMSQWASKSPTFSSTVWSIPPSSQFFIAPVTPTVNKIDTSVSFQYDNFQQSIAVQNTSVPINNQFAIINPARNNNKMGGQRKFQKQPYFHKRPQKGAPRMMQKKQDMGDLRLILSSKKINAPSLCEVQSDKGCENAQVEQPRLDDTISSSDIDSNCSSMCTKNPLKLCLKPLKDLAIAGANPGSWFIVPDTSVLMDSLNYLSMLVKADEHCRLLVPQFVMMNLQSIAFSNDDLKFCARNVIRLLTQQFDAGSAEIGSLESSQIENKESAHVFNCCRKLAEKKNHVILISNSKDMLRYKYITHIPIFTLEEVKSLLSLESFSHSNQSQPLVDQSSKETSFKDETHLKIPVPNDQKTFIKNVSPRIEPKLNFEIKSRLSSKESSIASSSIDIERNLKTDAGVQTDLHTEINCDSGNTISVTPLFSRDCSRVLAKGGTNEKNVTNDSTCKKREIRLKRQYSSQKSEEYSDNAASEKKQFKWRRRKNPTQSNPISLDKASGGEISEGTQAVPELFIASFSSDGDLHDKEPANVPADIMPANVLEPPSKCTNELECNKPTNVIECYKPSISEIMYDANTEGSDSNCSIQINVSEKIVIEETSTSGIISNTESNVDSESIISVKPKLLGIGQQRDVAKDIIFEISNSSMEEYLHTRRDEWIFRFYQIMEDILTEVLQRAPQFMDADWPSPWTLPEATQCIAIKFSSEPRVVEAANKLINILLKISNVHGGINKHVKPSEYMEMYSYGVHLVGALQDVCNHDDLQVAVESLNKLLKDIQNPIQDGGHNDTFTDIRDSSHNKSSEEVHHKSKDDEDIKLETTSVTSKYNLRSSKNVTEKKEEKSQQVTFVRNIDIEYSFFDTLKLQKTPRETEIRLPQDSEISSKGATNSELNCYFDNENELDYEEDCEDEECEEGEYSEDEYDNNDVKTFCPTQDFNEVEEPLIKPAKVTDQKLKYFIGVFIKHISSTFLTVQDMCEKYYGVVKNHQLEGEKRDEMRAKAEQAQAHMENLCESLNSILRREKNAEGRIQNLMKIADIDFVLDEDMSLEYRKMVAKCKEEAESVLSSVKFILSTS